MDKCPLHERVEWVLRNDNSICGQVLSSSGSSTSGRRPRSRSSLRAVSGTITEDWPDYCSGLPVGLDATQSGIQHYAAASLNPSDGKLVNHQER